MSELHVGFTGTRHGMDAHQRDEFLRLLLGKGDISLSRMTHFHHGDCIGADAMAHDMVRRYTTACIVVHPGWRDTSRAHKQGNETKAALPFLQRNKVIVNACCVLIATPLTRTEVLRSGTWSTVRYARKRNILICVLYPQGAGD